MTTEEGNKLIAEFYSIKHESDNGREYYLLPDMKTESRTGWYQPHDMIFHSSWNWLMPVVEKIEGDFFKDMYSVEIIDHKTTITKFRSLKENWEIIISVTEDSKIKCTWKAVVSFIQWYNSYISNQQTK